ncbi:MAG: GyrI-like domain-containing protein [Longimicrobiales bacterium]
MTNKNPITPTEVQFQPVLAAQVYTASATDPAEMKKAFGLAVGQIDDFLQSTGAQVSGPPRAIYTEYGEGEAEFTVAIPLASGGEGGTTDGSVVVDEIPGGRAFRFIHKGPYPDLSDTYDQITEWMKKEGMLKSEAEWEAHAPIWEEYVTDPGSTPEDDLLTYIYVPMP